MNSFIKDDNGTLMGRAWQLYFPLSHWPRSVSVTRVRLFWHVMKKDNVFRRIILLGVKRFVVESTAEEQKCILPMLTHTPLMALFPFGAHSSWSNWPKQVIIITVRNKSTVSGCGLWENNQCPIGVMFHIRPLSLQSGTFFYNSRSYSSYTALSALWDMQKTEQVAWESH